MPHSTWIFEETAPSLPAALFWGLRLSPAGSPGWAPALTKHLDEVP